MRKLITIPRGHSSLEEYRNYAYCVNRIKPLDVIQVKLLGRSQDIDYNFYRVISVSKPINYNYYTNTILVGSLNRSAINDYFFKYSSGRQSDFGDPLFHDKTANFAYVWWVLDNQSIITSITKYKNVKNQVQPDNIRF